MIKLHTFCTFYINKPQSGTISMGEREFKSVQFINICWMSATIIFYYGLEGRNQKTQGQLRKDSWQYQA